MQHTAYLSRAAVETGASLVISGSQLTTGDILEITTSNRESLAVTVSAFGLARLVIKAQDSQFECRPWKSEDDLLKLIPGPTSRWTVSKMLKSTS